MGKYIAIIGSMFVFISCAHAPQMSDPVGDSRRLEAAIILLSDSINQNDAKLVSEALIASTSELALSYHMASPPRYHNLLIHMGMKKRGLCCHWAEDLRTSLIAINQDTIQIDWLVANHGSPLTEHNSLVIYAENMGWQQGIVFDPWRKSGRPYWVQVSLDNYSWQQHPLSGKWDRLRCN